jgi:hypothetical protein
VIENEHQKNDFCEGHHQCDFNYDPSGSDERSPEHTTTFLSFGFNADVNFGGDVAIGKIMR